MPIQVLPEDVINQIAAGEVVERPAHLVKELVENAIDAGATEVEVDFSQGGRLVRVRDNGSGIPADELALAVQRHATSKITQTEDLWKVGSFGFRGEALASIAAVSHLTIQSAHGDQPGHQIEVVFGQVKAPMAAGALRGTTIFVQRLFENVPARLKFLKSDAAESSQIKNILKALAMAHPSVGLRVRHNESLLFYWPPATSISERVMAVLEQPEMYENHVEVERFQARVVVAPPHRVAHQPRQVWVFVKNRFVQDRSLQHAVVEAFRGLLMHGEYPIAAVFLECPPSELDVNIHPTKSQVKFRNSSLGFRVVHHAVRQLLERAPWVSTVVGAQPAPVAPAPAIQPSATPMFQTRLHDPSLEQTHLAQRDSAPLPTLADLRSLAAERPQVTALTDGRIASVSQTPARWSDLALIGQADLTYILTQNDRALVLVDQHAAHERVLYEDLMAGWKAKDIESQAMLIPLTVDLADHEVEAMTPHLTILKEVGLEVDILGPQTLAVRSHPALIREEAVVTALRRMADEIERQGESFSLEKVMSEAFATMACHSAVRAGKPMSLAEMKSLLQQMDTYSLSSFCPHGRPVFVEIPFAELERRFGRIV